ncbi:MAG: homocysteine S-methyltransferase [Planctomycetota bacterium]
MHFRNHLILDGGLATELESRGHVLNDALWSARLIEDAPRDIVDVHLAYLQAGADIITSASYQASIQGFRAAGHSHDSAIEIICKAVALAREARDRHVQSGWTIETFHQTFIRDLKCESWFDGSGTLARPLVAASIGPYGAYLANGAEFTGNYDLDANGLRDFHHDRWQSLAESGADMLICETVPSFVEATVLADLASKTNTPVLMSFSCRNKSQISDGTSMRSVASMLQTADNIKAIGINCTSPAYILPLIEEIHAESQLPVLVYPNSGEIFDGETRSWTGQRDAADFGEAALKWHTTGASIIGGCCRTSPEHIRSIRANLTAAG